MVKKLIESNYDEWMINVPVIDINSSPDGDLERCIWVPIQNQVRLECDIFSMRDPIQSYDDGPFDYMVVGYDFSGNELLREYETKILNR